MLWLNCPSDYCNQMTKTFRESVLQIVKAIPCGQTLSYGEVARRAGKPRAARAVGAIMRGNHNPDVPCHRVICANGKIGGYNRGANKKIALLNYEHLETLGKQYCPQSQEDQKAKDISGRGDEN